ncbi:hypothetical protein GGH12_003368 [Coemansia sp. RSA 1822]|nr:hypothetical protein LPJ76_001899 [Coemansia sp. RSA 638]KAJ2121132.1 hypothetical protein IW147_004510 [Coemansia sp. RSA 720]KAJ2482890.1 hypothetical protein IWW56_000731 [Coemansia sp. RSA 2131]KAJ2562247.1 hypothetical protein GGH12_003368 [Coemansia sp. RSA 1822]
MGRLHLAPQALVCKNTILEGDIRIGNGTVVHIDASIIAKNGPIIIGSNNIISDRVRIINNHATPLVIGDNNQIETDAVIEGRGIGHKNVVQVRGKVVGTSTLGNNCVVGVMCETEPAENVPDNTILFGNPQSRRTRSDNNAEYLEVHNKHLQYVHEMLPRYNAIIGAE